MLNSWGNGLVLEKPDASIAHHLRITIHTNTLAERDLLLSYTQCTPDTHESFEQHEWGSSELMLKQCFKGPSGVEEQTRTLTRTRGDHEPRAHEHGHEKNVLGLRVCTHGALSDQIALKALSGRSLVPLPGKSGGALTITAIECIDTTAACRNHSKHEASGRVMHAEEGFGTPPILLFSSKNMYVPHARMHA